MRRIARTALACGLALWIPACGSEEAATDAGDVSGEELATVPAAIDTAQPGDTALVAAPGAEATAFGGESGARGQLESPGDAPPATDAGESRRAAAQDGAPARDAAAPPALTAGRETAASASNADAGTGKSTSASTGTSTAAAGRTTTTTPASASADSPARPPVGDEPAARPFAVGERLAYEVRFGPLAVGTATMQVLDITTVRGIPAYHTRFEVRGGNRLYRVQDRYESWFDTRTLASLRYMQDINEGNYERTSMFEIFPDQRRFVEEGKEPQPTVELPLDEGSFIYWMRTIPLEVGQTYSFDRYFRPDRNPVRIEVLRRERVKVPAGTFDAIVVRPVIKTRGIFSEGGRAEIWFADDSTRRIVQMKSRLSFGSLNLYLK